MVKIAKIPLFPKNPKNGKMPKNGDILEMGFLEGSLENPKIPVFPKWQKWGIWGKWPKMAIFGAMAITTP